MKSKHRIHVIHESEDYSGTGRNPITNFDKGNEFFEATKKRPNNLEKLQHALFTIKPTSVEPEKVFSATELFVRKLRNRLNNESVL